MCGRSEAEGAVQTSERAEGDFRKGWSMTENKTFFPCDGGLDIVLRV